MGSPAVWAPLALRTRPVGWLHLEGVLGAQAVLQVSGSGGQGVKRSGGQVHRRLGSQGVRRSEGQGVRRSGGQWVRRSEGQGFREHVVSHTVTEKKVTSPTSRSKMAAPRHKTTITKDI